MNTNTNQHPMLKLPRDVKFRKNFVDAVNNRFEPNDLFIKLCVVPHDFDTVTNELMSSFMKAHSNKVVSMVQEVQKDILSYADADANPNFIVLFEYGYNQFFNAYIFHEVCLADKFKYKAHLDWYTKKWADLNEGYRNHVECVGHIVKVPGFLNVVVGLKDSKKIIYVNQNLSNPAMTSYFNDSLTVIRPKSGRYLQYVPFIDLGYSL